MFDANLKRRLWWTAGGLVVGLVLGGVWPHSPAHAVATSQIDNFAACTAPLDNEVEGIFLLDSVTGDLKGAAINPNTRTFTVFFSVNVASAFELDAAAKPRYLLVSGLASFRGTSGNQRPANSVLYVAEMTSGKVMAYGIPWSSGSNRPTQPVQLTLAPLGGFPFRANVVRNP
jgi:hypothetical protein